MSRMTVDDHYDRMAEGVRTLKALELEWALLYLEFRRAENHFTNWVLDLREPDPQGFQQRIVELEEKAQKVSEADREGTEYFVRECKKYYYRKFPLARRTLRQFVVLASKKAGALVRGIASRSTK